MSIVFENPKIQVHPPLKLTAVHMKIMGKRPKIGENLGTKGLRVWGGNERLDTPNFMAQPRTTYPRNSQSPLWSVWKPIWFPLRQYFSALFLGYVRGVGWPATNVPKKNVPTPQLFLLVELRCLMIPRIFFRMWRHHKLSLKPFGIFFCSKINPKNTSYHILIPNSD